MDMLINVIIIAVIFITIVKRMKEVAQKGKELEAPPPVAPSVAPPPDERPEEIYPKIPVERAKQSKIQEILKEIEGKAISLSEDVWEQKQAFTEPVVEMTEQPGAEIPPPLSPGEAVVPKKEQRAGLQLSFQGRDVVTGIVMSEILGPPVSLRDE